MLRSAPWRRSAPGALSKRRIPLRYFDVPFHSPLKRISKLARISTQTELHLSDRQPGRSSHEVANKEGIKPAANVIWAADGLAARRRVRRRGPLLIEITGPSLKRLNTHVLKCAFMCRITHTHSPVEFSGGGSHAPRKLAPSRGVNKQLARR